MIQCDLSSNTLLLKFHLIRWVIQDENLCKVYSHLMPLKMIIKKKLYLLNWYFIRITYMRYSDEVWQYYPNPLILNEILNA